jgi:hypothetical protein
VHRSHGRQREVRLAVKASSVALAGAHERAAG